VRTARRRACEGFALIESIVVLALSALVLLTMLIAADLVTRNAAATSRRAHEVETLASGFAAMKRDLSGVMFVRGGTSAKSPILFQGTAGTLGFVVERDRPDLGYSNSLIWIAARYEEGRGTLERSSARLLPQNTSFAGVAFGDTAVLISGPWTYRFTYARPRGGAIEWTDSWSGARGLPRAVRLEVLDAGGAPVVPPLVAGLSVDAELNCADSDFGCPEEEAAETPEEEVRDEDDNEE
jgi:general secretion pathway protein J